MKSFCYIKKITFIFLMLFGLTLFFMGQEAFAANAIGQMVWVKGSVQAIDAGQHARILQRRSPIYELDTIVTASGTGQIIFSDSSTVVLREGTTFRIDEYKFNPTSPGDSKYVAGISKGGFRTITGLISKSNPEGYLVKTPVATIGVRGTQYSCYVRGQRLDFQLEKGIVSISNRGGVVVLNAAQNQVYAAVTGVAVRPVMTNKSAPIFRSQPPMVNSSGAAIPAPTPDITSSPNTINVTPKGPVKGFCIN